MEKVLFAFFFLFFQCKRVVRFLLSFAKRATHHSRGKGPKIGFEKKNLNGIDRKILNKNQWRKKKELGNEKKGKGKKKKYAKKSKRGVNSFNGEKYSENKTKKRVQKVCVLIIELTEKTVENGKKKNNLSVKKYTEGGRLANRKRKQKKSVFLFNSESASTQTYN